MTQQLDALGVSPEQDFANTFTKNRGKKRARGSDKKRFEDEFAFQVRAHELPKPFSYINSSKDLSYQFHFAKDVGDAAVESRAFRADFAWPEFRLLVEIQGGIWRRGGGAHSHPLDIERDVMRGKYAALLGWFVLPITTDEVRNGQGIAWLQRVLVARGWKA